MPQWQARCRFEAFACRIDAWLRLDGIEALGRVVPKQGFIGRHNAHPLVLGRLGGPFHWRAFCDRGSLGTASARAGASFASSTMNRAGCLVTPARRPAASPEPKYISPRSGPLMAEPTSCAIMSR